MATKTEAGVIPLGWRGLDEKRLADVSQELERAKKQILFKSLQGANVLTVA